MKTYELDISEELMCEMMDMRFISMPTMVFEMTEAVDPDGLKYAAERAMTAHPYFRTRLVKQGISFKLEENAADFPVLRTELKDVVEFGDETNAGFQWMLSFSGHSIFVDVSHFITDGSGAQIFATDLMEFYCEYIEGRKTDAEIPDEQRLAAECALPSDLACDPDAEPFYTPKEWSPAPFRENTFIGADSSEFILFSVPSEEVIKAARKAEVSPFAVFAPLLAKASRTLVDSFGENKGIGVMFPFSARNLFDSVSFHNFVPTRTIVYDYDKLSDIDIGLASTACRAQIDLLSQKEDVSVESTKKAYARKMLGDADARKSILQMLNNAVHNPSQITFTFMNRCRLSESALSHIERNYFAVNASKGLGYVICVGINDGKCIRLSIPNSFTSDGFFDEFREELRHADIKFTEECIYYPSARFAAMQQSY